MATLEKINSPHKIGLGISPNEADLAIVSIDNIGTPGRLNLSVLKEYGYSNKDLPKEKDLMYGFGQIPFTEKKKAILFVVTVGNGQTAENLRKNLYNTLTEFRGWFRSKRVWIPLMGAGDGRLSLEESYIITSETINHFQNNYPTETTFLVSLPNDVSGKKLQKEIIKLNSIAPTNVTATITFDNPQINQILSKINSRKNINFWWINANPDFWKITDFKIGEEQSYDTHNENGNPRRVLEHFYEAKAGDYAIGYETKKKRKIIALFEITKGAVNREGDELFFKIAHFFEYQTSWAELSRLNFFTNTEVYRSPEGSLFKLSHEQFFEIIDTVTSKNPQLKPNKNNLLKNVSLNNDWAQADKDLLGFENDIRAFSSLIALKELKPPLAIALFGKWGSGKSFFMYNLQKRIDFLSKHQGFEELLEVDKGQNINEEPFCKGVAQICFNAWSYMDANLWASLVANIFEKLDEYINEQTKGGIAKEKAKAILNQKLLIVNEEKEKILIERKELVKEKDNLTKQINEIEKNKLELLEKLSSQTTEEILKTIKEKVPIEESLKQALRDYGITQERINQFSPDVILNETKSWLKFFQNLMMFSKKQLALIILGVLILLSVFLIPKNIIFDFIGQSKTILISFLVIAGPIFTKFYKTCKQFYEAYEPIKNYRDKFNQKLEAINEQHEKDLKKINLELTQKQFQLEAKNTNLENLTEQINDLEYDLNHSIACKAFFGFINSKVKDENYDKNLGIISTIRRDFETLSDLFRDYNIPDNLNEEEKEKAKEKKKESDDFKDLFKKPLDRIVLYVDDLDRCPEDRVIEVLEAVNLLMAYPLFVVVVGVDPRWVKNALVKKYTLQFTGLLNNQDHMEKYGIQPIHVTDYLEKIFQIPFHLNEADENGVDNLLDSIFENQIEERELKEEILSKQGKEAENKITPTKRDLEKTTETLNFAQVNQKTDDSSSVKKIPFKPEDLKISKQELDDLKDFAWLVGNNPRSLKRFANMYRLVRAHENLKYDEQTEQEDFLAVIFILGISVGEYKFLASDFYRACQENTKFNFIKLIGKLDAKKALVFLEKLKNRKPHQTLNLLKGESFNKYIPFIKRFSFENNRYL